MNIRTNRLICKTTKFDGSTSSNHMYTSYKVNKFILKTHVNARYWIIHPFRTNPTAINFSTDPHTIHVTRCIHEQVSMWLAIESKKIMNNLPTKKNGNVEIKSDELMLFIISMGVRVSVFTIHQPSTSLLESE